MAKAVFLDRDGVINKNAAEHDYIKSWEEFKVLPRVPEALAKLKSLGYLLIVISNQRGIARGMMTSTAVEEIHIKLNEYLKKYDAQIDAFYYCPHDYSDKCNCRKPKIGMLLQAQKDFNLNFDECWFIGDRKSDRECGNNAKIKTIILSKDESLYEQVLLNFYGEVNSRKNT